MKYSGSQIILNLLNFDILKASIKNRINSVRLNDSIKIS